MSAFDQGMRAFREGRPLDVHPHAMIDADYWTEEEYRTVREWRAGWRAAQEQDVSPRETGEEEGQTMKKLTIEQAERLTPVPSATLRTDHLITAFHGALHGAAITEDGRVDSELLDRLGDAAVLFDDECKSFAWQALRWSEGHEVRVDELHPLRDAAEVYLEELTGLLEELAPDGMYFGAHVGDGACFGFWIEEEE